MKQVVISVNQSKDKKSDNLELDLCNINITFDYESVLRFGQFLGSMCDAEDLVVVEYDEDGNGCAARYYLKEDPYDVNQVKV